MHGGASDGDGSVWRVGVGGMGKERMIVVGVGEVVGPGMRAMMVSGMGTRGLSGMRTR